MGRVSLGCSGRGGEREEEKGIWSSFGTGVPGRQRGMSGKHTLPPNTSSPMMRQPAVWIIFLLFGCAIANDVAERMLERDERADAEL